jgi:hypothetical protein
MMRSSVICTPHQNYYTQIKKEKMVGAYSRHRRHAKFKVLSENVKERRYL